MIFLIKFVVKGVFLFAFEMGVTISELASHIVSPAKMAYRVVVRSDFSNTEDENPTRTQAEYLIRPQYDNHP